MMRFGTIAAAVVAVAVSGSAFAQGKAVQGVTKDEVVIGSHTDLSGPAAIWGVSVTNGLRMRLDEVNAAGGVHGRKIKVIVEDSGYTIPKAVAATDKLLKRDKVFAMLGNLGTPMNMATLPEILKANVPNLFPLSAAATMYEPYERLKFAFLMPYGDQMRGAVKYFVEQRGKKRLGILYQDDDFGQDVLIGTETQLKAMGMELVAKTTYKRGAKDFSSQIAVLRQANADFVILGTIIAESIGAYAEAKKIGWNVDMIVSTAGYTPQVAELAPQGVTAGLYGAGQSPILYPDTAPPEAKVWMENYKKKFNREADVQATAGYGIADMFVTALDRAGKDLTVDAFVKGVESIQNYRDIFGGAPQTFGPNRRIGADTKNAASLYQIDRNKRWVYVDRLSF